MFKSEAKIIFVDNSKPKSIELAYKHLPAEHRECKHCVLALNSTNNNKKREKTNILHILDTHKLKSGSVRRNTICLNVVILMLADHCRSWIHCMHIMHLSKMKPNSLFGMFSS